MKNGNSIFKNLTKIVISIIICLTLIAIIPVTNVSASTNANSNVSDKQYYEGTLDDDFSYEKIIIVLTKEETNKFREYSIADFAEIDCVSIIDLTGSIFDAVKYNNANNTLIDIDNFNRILCLELEDKTKENVLESIKKLEHRNDILSAEPDVALQYNYIPNDTKYGEQWGLNKIHSFDLFDIFRNGAKVIVGVVDTGIDSTHDDLENIIYKGSPHNLTTTLHRDFTDGSDHGEAILNPTDKNGHGTHVAGIIGAEVDNSLGISGVSRNVSLVSLRVLNSSGKGELSWPINAINYAASVNIPILNCSFGSPSTTFAFQKAVENYKGLLVCAAGNDDNNTDRKPNYPSSYSSDNIISVGATDSNDNRSNWNGFHNLWGFFGLTSSKSNYGATTVDLFAPGTDILSTFPENKYSAKSGTSMAAPFVTGAAAVLLSINSDLTAYQLKNALLEGTEYRSSLSGLCVTEGRLNVYNSIKYILNHYSNTQYTLGNYSATVNENKIIISGDSHFDNKNGFYKLNVTYAKDYEFIISSTKILDVTLYDEDFNELNTNDLSSDNLKIHIIKNLSVGTYYLRTTYKNENDSGIINTKIISRNTVYLNYNQNDILLNTYNGIEDYYYINTKGAGFYEFKLNGTKADETTPLYSEGAITIYNDSNKMTPMEKFNLTGYLNSASTKANENSMIVYLPRNGYFYIDVNISSDNLSSLFFEITSPKSQDIDLFDFSESTNESVNICNETIKDLMKIIGYLLTYR